MNSLIGLETGVIPDEAYVIKWDGTRYDVPAWNQTHTLKTAIRNSAVWYYQELARRVGKVYIFATNVGGGDGNKAQEITRNILQGLGLLQVGNE